MNVTHLEQSTSGPFTLLPASRRQSVIGEHLKHNIAPLGLLNSSAKIFISFKKMESVISTNHCNLVSEMT